MIAYLNDNPLSLVRWKGSVAPKALRWAVVSALLAVLYSYILHQWTDWGTYMNTEEPTKFETTGWSLFTYVLGFMIVFRAQLSYQRYWEGITLVEQACGVWLNGFSNLIAFCTVDPEKQQQVEEFQYILSRLMSLLFSYCMSDISNLDGSRFPHLDLAGIDPACLEYLEATSAKQNVALQWIQRMVVENSRSNVIDIAPPILSRVFQEFSIGIVHFMDAKKISVVPFPFGFAQMLWVMLVFFSVLPLPIICALGMNAYQAAIYCFLITLLFWSVNHLAIEIEQPFGDDPNDLPLEQVNHRFNKVLLRLQEMSAQQTPTLMKKPDMSMRFMRRKSSVNEHAPVPPVPILAKMRSFLGEMEFPTHSGSKSSDNLSVSSRHASARSRSSTDGPLHPERGSIGFRLPAEDVQHQGSAEDQVPCWRSPDMLAIQESDAAEEVVMQTPSGRPPVSATNQQRRLFQQLQERQPELLSPPGGTCSTSSCSSWSPSRPLSVSGQCQERPLMRQEEQPAGSQAQQLNGRQHEDLGCSSIEDPATRTSNAFGECLEMPEGRLELQL